MTPYYSDEYVTLYHGDCREVLPEMDPCDLLLSDPPYSSGGFQEAGKSAGSVGTRWDGALAMDNLSTRGYRRLIADVLRAAAWSTEVMLFTDWRMWVETSDALEYAGLRVRAMLVWDKGTPGMGRPWRGQHELVAYARRGSAGESDTKAQGNVLRVARSGNVHHPTEKPVGLLTRLIQGASSNGCVVDPFAGSGSTLVAAKMIGRACVGIEASEALCEIAARRLSQEVFDFGGAA